MEARSQALLCQEVEGELRELSQECRKRFPSIKDYTERAIAKIRHHRELVEQAAAEPAAPLPIRPPEFPLDEVLKSVLMACETFQSKIVLLSLSCLQKLIHRRVLKEATVAIVINLMKEQATNGDEAVQLKVLQTIMATPAHMTLLNEVVVEQLMQLFYVLHNSNSPCVHHTAVAGLRHLAESLTDRAADDAERNGVMEGAASRSAFDSVRPVVRRAQTAPLPNVAPSQAPSTLSGVHRMLFVFTQDLCVMADYDASSLSSRYAVDAGERMRTGSREGYWLAQVKFPRPLCLELLGTCLAANPVLFLGGPACFALLRQGVCAVLLKNLRGCFDFAILIRSIHLLQRLFGCPALAAPLMPELQVFLHLMLDLTAAERSLWQRATSLEFLSSVCEDPAALAVLYEHGGSSGASPANSGPRTTGSQSFLELVDSLSKLIHQVCFSTGMDSGALLHSAAAGAGPSPTSTGNQRVNGADSGRGLLMVDASFVGGSSMTNSGSSSSLPAARSSTQAARVRLLQLMSETDPPTVQPSLLVALVIESVLAIVSSLYRLLLAASGDEALLPLATARSRRPSTGGTSMLNGQGEETLPTIGFPPPDMERCRGMVSDSWASLLSALSLLLHGTTEEQGLQQALRCVQTLLYCCSRLGLEQARDACLLQLTRYALPGLSREAEIAASPGGSSNTISSGSSSVSGSGANQKNLLCCKALLHFCLSHGRLLGVAGWTIALRALSGLERMLQRASSQGNELTVVRQSLDSLFETTALLPIDALSDIVDAIGENIRRATDSEEGSILLGRLGELCSFNVGRLLALWDRVMRVITDVCMLGERGELRVAAAAALCKILAQALRRGALAMAEQPEDAQRELLQQLTALLQSPHADARARISEGLLQVLQASGQEFHPATWGTMIHLVATAARVELQRAGLFFTLPKQLDVLPPTNDKQAGQDDTTGSILSESPLPSMQPAISTTEGRDAGSSVLPTVFQLLELLVHDFMEYVPPTSVPQLTASIGAFARFTGLGVNSSLTAVGFLWNVADALARYHCMPLSPSSAPVQLMQAPPNGGGSTQHLMPSSLEEKNPGGGGAHLEELWVQIFMQLRALAVDGRPEVRNCAIKSLTSALLSHGRKVGAACYERCLRDILVEILTEVQEAAKTARTRDCASALGGARASDGLLVHHSRDTPEKQWDETMVLGMERFQRVLSNFSEEAGVQAFAPLAYTLLLQVQATLRTLTAEVSGSALRALVDLMRIPASSQMFEVQGTLVGVSALQVPAKGETSIWQLGWSVLWGFVDFCMARDVPESLMETFATTLNALRNSHRHLLTPDQHVICWQLSLVLVTSPSFYLPTSTPLKADGRAGCDDVQGVRPALAAAARTCLENTGECGDEVLRFVEAAPDMLFRLDARTRHCRQRTFVKTPGAVTRLVDANPSRNFEIGSMESAIADVARSDGPTTQADAVQAFLGAPRSPTHRTMLFISSARLQHVQSSVFALLEETHSLPSPALEGLFIALCCAAFLNLGRVLEDSNKLALAARTLCLLVLFTRRTLLQHLAGTPSAGSDAAIASTGHLEALLGQSVPHICRVVTALACCHGFPQLHESGLWRLAVEMLLYLMEDTLPAVEKAVLGLEASAAYWDAVMGSLQEVSAVMVPQPGLSPGDAADADLLTQAMGNFVANRLLTCSSAPPKVAEAAVGLLEKLAGLRSDVPQSSRMASMPSVSLDLGALGHLFDLCSCPEHTKVAAEEERQHRQLSVAAATAAAAAGRNSANIGCSTGSSITSSTTAPQQTGAAAPAHHPAPPPPARFPARGVLLHVVAPALLRRLRALFTSFSEEDGHARNDEALARRAEEVRLVLVRLHTLHVDEAAVAAVAAALPLRHEQASAASINGTQEQRACGVCRLSGPKALAMALLPQLATLAAAGDSGVRQGVSDVLSGLALELGF